MKNYVNEVFPRELHQCSPNTFGPASCTGDFDFTLLFEQAILVTLPAAAFLLATPLRLRRLRKASIKTLPSRVHVAKIVSISPMLRVQSSLTRCYYQVTASLFAIFQLVLLVLWCAHAELRTVASVPSATLTFAVSLAFVALLHVEHTRSPRPSTLICIYLLFSTIFDGVLVRTIFLSGQDTSIAAVICCTIGFKLLLLWLEATNKTSYLRPSLKSLSPEATAGVIDWTFLWWLNHIFVVGYQKLMTMEDLYAVPQDMETSILGERLHDCWNTKSSAVREDQALSKWTLPLAVWSCFKWEISWVFPARLCLIGFNYAQPFLFARAISFVEEPSTPGNNNIGYGLIGATGLIYIGIAVRSNHKTIGT